MLSLIFHAMSAQWRMTRRNVEDLFPVLTIPLSSVLSLSILRNAGRDDLAGYALVAVGLMSIGQMAFFVASEILANEREGQTLELMVASPTPCYAPLLCRIIALTSIGTLGFAEAWVFAWVLFGLHVRIYHPVVLLGTLALTIVAASATALITSTVFCFGSTTRTYQNAIAGPLYLLAGVLVPVAFLPWFIRPISRGIFLFWAADLLRDALDAATPHHVLLRLGAIAALGLAGGVVGGWLFNRLLTHLRAKGTLGL